MPYVGEHAARIRPEKGWDRVRRVNDKFGPGIDVLFGFKRDKSEVQSIRFDAKRYTVAEAKAWLKRNRYKPLLFQPAKKGEEPMKTNGKQRVSDAEVRELLAASGKTAKTVGFKGEDAEAVAAAGAALIAANLDDARVVKEAIPSRLAMCHVILKRQMRKVEAAAGVEIVKGMTAAPELSKAVDELGWACLLLRRALDHVAEKGFVPVFKALIDDLEQFGSGSA